MCVLRVLKKVLFKVSLLVKDYIYIVKASKKESLFWQRTQKKIIFFRRQCYLSTIQHIYLIYSFCSKYWGYGCVKVAMMHSDHWYTVHILSSFSHVK